MFMMAKAAGMLAQQGGASVGPQTFVAAATGTQTTSATNNANIPAGVVDGDLLIALCYHNTASRTVTSPGWTEWQYASGLGSFTVLAKVASGEGATATFTFSTSLANSVIIVAYRGGYGTFDQVGTVSSADTATPAAPAITATQAGKLLAFFANEASGAPSAGPSGMTQRAALTSSNPALLIYELSPSGTGSTGTKSITLGDNADAMAALIQIV